MAVEVINLPSEDQGFVQRVVAIFGGLLLKVILVLTFVLIVTPISLVRRAFGSDPMFRSFTDEQSYRRPSRKTPNARLEKSY